MRVVLSLALVFGAASVTLPAFSEVPQERRRGDEGAMQRLSYGEDRLQAMLYWPGASADAPLVVFVHGGGWSRGDMRMMVDSDKLRHWQAQGYAVVSVNYRLVPDATVEQQASDVASAVAALHSDAGTLGLDRSRIVLAGHSAGAHLAALVGSDPQYLAAEGLSVGSLRGVLALDGAGYDVPAQMEDARGVLRRTYLAAFGEDRARQQRLSPITHVAAPNAPDFLVLYVDRDASRGQSLAFAQPLARAGTPARSESIPGRGLRGHMEINRRLGDPDYPATAVVDGWLAEVLR